MSSGRLVVGGCGCSWCEGWCEGWCAGACAEGCETVCAEVCAECAHLVHVLEAPAKGVTALAEGLNRAAQLRDVRLGLRGGLPLLLADDDARVLSGGRKDKPRGERTSPLHCRSPCCSRHWSAEPIVLSSLVLSCLLSS